jgi:hypothetical protein
MDMVGERAPGHPREIGWKLKVSADHPEQGFYRPASGKPPRSGPAVNALAIWNWCCRLVT